MSLATSSPMEAFDLLSSAEGTGVAVAARASVDCMESANEGVGVATRAAIERRRKYGTDVATSGATLGA